MTNIRSSIRIVFRDKLETILMEDFYERKNVGNTGIR